MLPSGLPEDVADHEDIARFLTQSTHYNTVTVKAVAFMPKDDETSVSRHGRHPETELWSLGLGAVGSSGRNLHGAGILKAAAIRETGLEIVSAEPPPRHAVVVGWPTILDDPEKQKSRRKELALKLAAAAGTPVLHKLESR